MSRKAARVLVLCEDSQQSVFIYRLLKKLGFSRYGIHIDSTPPGIGSGEQYVRNRYPVQVKAHRQKNYLELRLIVMIDADRRTFQQRQNQLADSLRRAEVQRRSRQECIALLIPRRNIETWIHSLLETRVDEETAYAKFTGNESACHPAVEKLLGYLKNEVPDSLPDSLQRGCKELKQRLIDCQYK